jgi:hypothetical protein
VNLRDREREKEYIRIWNENGPLLEAIRDQEIREADTAQSIRMFDQAFRIALRSFPPEPWSGLVEWQDYMKRWRQRG